MTRLVAHDGRPRVLILAHEVHYRGGMEQALAQLIAHTHSRVVNERGSRRDRLRRGGLSFGMVGRLAPWKGQDVFLRAFARAFPDGDSRAILVGAALFGETSYGEDLRVLAAKLGIADRVSFRGFREDVDAELAMFDVLVHASRSPEPAGQVVLEGMSAGLPVVAADAGGPAEVIRDGANGRLFRIDDVTGLARILDELASSPEDRRRLGVSARETAAAYRPDLVSPQLAAIYARALHAGSSWAARWRGL